MKPTREKTPEWMDLRALTGYAAVSERTLRAWIHATLNPLPASCVGRKLLVNRAAFDSWLERHRIKAFESDKIGSIVDEVMAGIN